MKLKGLQDIILQMTGSPILDNETKKAVARANILMGCLGAMKVDAPADSIIAFDLGTRIYRAEKGICEVKPEEYAIIKKAIEQNVPGYFTFIQGQMLAWLSVQGE